MRGQKIRLVRLEQITVMPGGRPIDASTVGWLIDSFSKIGMQNPVTLFRLPGMRPRYILTAGAHRFEACKALGYTHVLAFVLSEDEAKLNRSSENLHRAPLRVLDEMEQIWKYHASKQPARFSAQPHDQGISSTARELNKDRRSVREARLVTRIAPEIRAELVAAGLDNSRAAIVAIAQEKNSESQRMTIQRLAVSGVRKRTFLPQSATRKKVVKTYAIPQSSLELQRLWRSSLFMKQFEAAPPLVKREFVRTNFSLWTEADPEQ